MHATACLDEVERSLTAAAASVDPAKTRERAAYMKAVLPLHGLTVPASRRLAKQGFSFSGLPFEEQFPIWDHIWRHAPSHDAKLQPVLWLEGLMPRPPAETLWPLLKSWATDINCWDHSDGLSAFYAAHLEAMPTTVYPVLAAWNDSANSWQRRQSLVSLFFYARFRTKQPQLGRVLPLVEARLGDPDYYVQKGVGWCLREAFNVYPARTLAFLRKHAGALDPAAWQAATEKLDAADKADLKRRRGSRTRGPRAQD